MPLTPRRCLSALLLGVTAALSSPAQALENDLGNAVQSVAGIYSSIWIHEMGHALTFHALGATDIEIKVPREGCRLCGETTSKSPAGGYQLWHAQAIAGSGLLAANLAGELVIQRQSLHGSAFAQSVLGSSLVSNAIHVYTYYTRYVGVDGYRGNDIDAFAASGGNPHLFSAALLAYTAWSLQRMRQKEIPFFYVNLRF
ncbi:MAG: hypothetical protein PHS32_06085 [Rhodoferax sp.]|uniref:hypothetical protein n=1 Tax=Rhodoferax sp. TaxID=50421 RepID=UPI00261B62AD|nr:hypothetical protein [Rhodoferax sp.]MDD5333300.1 hypothetical protein [Rhodoferax sp.]